MVFSVAEAVAEYLAVVAGVASGDVIQVEAEAEVEVAAAAPQIPLQAQRSSPRPQAVLRGLLPCAIQCVLFSVAPAPLYAILCLRVAPRPISQLSRKQ